MITRAWWGKTPFDKANDYIRHLEGKVLPELRKIDGHKGAYILRRDLHDGVEFAVLTLWESMEAIRQFAGEDPERAVVTPEAKALLREFDSKVKHYEIVSGPDP
jgi:heme-degrading monooxygenase HmoA